MAIFQGKCSIERFYERISSDPVALLYVLKKYLQYGEDLAFIAEELTDDRNAFIQIFISYPEFEDLFFKKVEELADIESRRIQKRALVLGLKELTDSLTSRRDQVDPKDRVASARALISYELSSRPKGKAAGEKTELEALFDTLQSFKEGKDGPNK